ncbi:nose resistant to fluoxetine protein 6-like [Lineus longissimus]|uniref:nose resistant to fluoxetine protein 6-like n=1 Tax=Lineus longissimus TaxID=88925 RepID=UPI002B4EB264
MVNITWRPVVQVTLLVMCAAIPALAFNASTLTMETFTNEVLKDVLGHYVKVASDLLDLLKTPNVTITVSSRCLADAKLTLQKVKEKDDTALNILDSFGKPPPGIKYGYLIWLGSFDQCRTSKGFRTAVPIKEDERDVIPDNVYCQSEIAYPGTKYEKEKQFRLKIALCMPESCKSGDDVRGLTRIGMQAIEGLSLQDETTFRVTKSWCSRYGLTLSWPAYLAFFLLFIVIVLVIVGSIYDIVLRNQATGGCCSRQNEKKQTMDLEMRRSEPSTQNSIYSETEEVGEATSDGKGREENKPPDWTKLSIPTQMVLAFSLVTNGKKILATHQPDGTLTVIHGIRFFSMLWIIEGHTLFWLQITQGWANPREVEAKAESPYYLTMMFGEFAVDTFFLLSGTLMSYLFLPEMRRRGGPRKINWVYYFFHRWWRLTPTLWLVMLTYLFVFPMFYDGPNWPQQDGGAEWYCLRNIWANLLYINNYIGGCMGWTWYLACEWQFYCGAPIIMCCFHRSRKLGLASIIVCVAWQFFSIFLLIMFTGDYSDDGLVYYSGSGRIGDYAIGLGLGYLLRKYRKSGIRISRGKQALSWCMLAVVWYPIMVPWHTVLAPFTTFLPPYVVPGFYIGIKRWWWTVGVAWIIFACSTGYGGFINTFLSWSAFIPLSRLTYCAYLLHPILMYVYQYGQRTLFHATDLTIHYLITGHLFNTYCLSFFVSLALEAPMIALEKVFMQCKCCKPCCTCCKKEDRVGDGADGADPEAGEMHQQENDKAMNSDKRD